MLTDMGWFDCSQWMRALGVLDSVTPVTSPSSSVIPIDSEVVRLKLATLNPASQSIEWHSPTAFILNDGEQRTVRVDSAVNGVHFEVTVDHDVYTARDSGHPSGAEQQQQRQQRKEEEEKEEEEQWSADESHIDQLQSGTIAAFAKVKASSLLLRSEQTAGGSWEVDDEPAAPAPSTCHHSPSASLGWRFQCGAANGVQQPLVSLDTVIPHLPLTCHRRRRAFFAALGAWLADGSIHRQRNRIGDARNLPVYHIDRVSHSALLWLRSRMRDLDWSTSASGASGSQLTRPHSLMRVKCEMGQVLGDWLWREYGDEYEEQQRRARTPADEEDGEQGDYTDQDTTEDHSAAALDRPHSTQPPHFDEDDSDDDGGNGEEEGEEEEWDAARPWTPSAQRLPELLVQAMSARDARALLQGLTWKSEQGSASRSLHTPFVALKEQLLRVAIIAGYSAHAAYHQPSVDCGAAGRPSRRCRGWLVEFSSRAQAREPLVSFDCVSASTTNRSWCLNVPPHHLILVRRRLPHSPCPARPSPCSCPARRSSPSSPPLSGCGSSPRSSSSASAAAAAAAAAVCAHSRGVWVGNCIAEGTLISLADGTSVCIEKVKCGADVLSYHAALAPGETEGLTVRQVHAVLDQGCRECVKLLFSDGRTLVCTPDHRIRTADGRWVEAKDLVVGTDEVAVGVEYPQATASAEGHDRDTDAYQSTDKVTYGVDLHAKVLPFFQVQLVGRREVGARHVYDLSVPSPQGDVSRSFVANGVVVHNCFEDERIYTYIQSRFYRSPEVLLGLSYSCSIDMWSLGCILCELYTGYPLFPGENEHEQLLCMMEVLGLPPKRMVHEASRKKHFFDANLQPILTANSRGKVRIPGSKPMEMATKCKDPHFVSFIRKCFDERTQLLCRVDGVHRWMGVDDLLKWERRQGVKGSAVAGEGEVGGACADAPPAAGSTVLVASYNEVLGVLEYHPMSDPVLVQYGAHRMVDITHRPAPSAASSLSRTSNDVSLCVTRGHLMYVQMAASLPPSPSRGAFRRAKAEQLLPRAPTEQPFTFLAHARAGVSVDSIRALPSLLLVSSPASSVALPFTALLSLETEDEEAAFLELYGYWLWRSGGQQLCAGCAHQPQPHPYAHPHHLTHTHRPGILSFPATEEADVAYLKSLLIRLGRVLATVTAAWVHGREEGQQREEDRVDEEQREQLGHGSEWRFDIAERSWWSLFTERQRRVTPSTSPLSSSSSTCSYSTCTDSTWTPAGCPPSPSLSSASTQSSDSSDLDAAAPRRDQPHARHHHHCQPAPPESWVSDDGASSPQLTRSCRPLVHVRIDDTGAPIGQCTDGDEGQEEVEAEMEGRTCAVAGGCGGGDGDDDVDAGDAGADGCGGGVVGEGLAWWVLACLAPSQLRLILRPASRYEQRVGDRDREGSIPSIATRSPHIRDDLVTLALHAGYSPSFTHSAARTASSHSRTTPTSPLTHTWTVHFSERVEHTHPTLHPHAHVTQHSTAADGRVWCVTVPPHHLVIARTVLEVDAGLRHRTVVRASRPIVVGQCLRWEPKTRMTPEQGLQHEWITQQSAAQQPHTTQLPTSPLQPSPTPPSHAAAVATPPPPQPSQPPLAATAAAPTNRVPPTSSSTVNTSSSSSSSALPPAPSSFSSTFNPAGGGGVGVLSYLPSGSLAQAVGGSGRAGGGGGGVQQRPIAASSSAPSSHRSPASSQGANGGQLASIGPQSSPSASMLPSPTALTLATSLQQQQQQQQVYSHHHPQHQPLYQSHPAYRQQRQPAPQSALHTATSSQSSSSPHSANSAAHSTPSASSTSSSASLPSSTVSGSRSLFPPIKASTQPSSSSSTALSPSAASSTSSSSLSLPSTTSHAAQSQAQAQQTPSQTPSHPHSAHQQAQLHSQKDRDGHSGQDKGGGGAAAPAYGGGASSAAGGLEGLGSIHSTITIPAHRGAFTFSVHTSPTSSASHTPHVHATPAAAPGSTTHTASNASEATVTGAAGGSSAGTTSSSASSAPAASSSSHAATPLYAALPAPHFHMSTT